MAARTQCCGVSAYIDKIDGRTCCTICDAEVDPKTGRVLTEREQDRAAAKRDVAGLPDPSLLRRMAIQAGSMMRADPLMEDWEIAGTVDQVLIDECPDIPATECNDIARDVVATVRKQYR